MKITNTTATRKGKTMKNTMRPFFVAVPHQRPAFLVHFDDNVPPIEEDGDQFTEGDHDYHAVHVVRDEADAARLLDKKRHQGILIATLVADELDDQAELAWRVEPSGPIYR